MVVREFHRQRKDGVNLYHIYSDIGKKLIQNETGIVYDDVIDVETAPYTYSESDESIELTAEEALAFILGGSSI